MNGNYTVNINRIIWYNKNIIMNDNYTIDINSLSYMELEELYGQSYATYTEELSIEFSSVLSMLKMKNKTEQK